MRNYFTLIILLFIATSINIKAENNAIFVSQNVPSAVLPGQTFTVSITMENTGATTWRDADNHHLGSQSPQDNTNWGLNRVYLSTDVATGEQYTFTFDCTAPSTPGTYDFQWQMVQDGLEWFGEVTPVIHIVVDTINNAEFVSFSNLPERLYPGETFTASITMRNTGTSTWTPAGNNSYSLGSQSPQDNFKWSTNRVLLPHDVSPGDTVTFTHTFTAPTSEGLYNFQWKMVQDGVEWFGDKTELGFIPVMNDLQDSLFTSSYNFHTADHVIGTTFFHWYGSGDWQYSSPWIPIEGRSSWDGSIDYWKRMIKQLMMADIDVIYVIVIPITEEARGNLFMALYELRSQGWNVPKVCPFLDPEITYSLLGYNGNAATQEGKDELVGHYIRFYRQYYAVNKDQFADDYIYTQDGRPVLNVWHVHQKIDNYAQLTRDDVTNRLSSAFGSQHPIFNNDIVMITNEISPSFSFADEKVAQFELQEYYHETNYNNVNTCLLKPGYWDQNVRDPGYILARDGGTHYRDSWQQVINNASSINRVQIESFNEYDEGSGIYAAKTDTIFRIPTNTNTDTWSDSNDPYEYLKDTYVGASQYNVYSDYASTILWHNFPDTMTAGDTVWTTVLVRNDGDLMWTAADDFKFGEKETIDPVTFGHGRYLIDDSSNDIPVYGGIFRGRVIEFNIPVIAPDTAGVFLTYWGMVREGVTWFGDTITKQIVVTNTVTKLNNINEHVKIYPNPAKNYLIVNGQNLNNKDIKIMDITGKIVKQTSTQSSTIKIEISDLNKGVYFIKVGDLTKRFVKQ